MITLSDLDGVVYDPCVYVKRYLTGPVKNWNGYFKHTTDFVTIPAVVNVLRGLMTNNNYVTFITGRPESNRKLTLDSLSKVFERPATDFQLLMRPNGNHGPAANLKLEWCLEHKPHLILEDEPSTVEVLRRRGFTVLQVVGHRLEDDLDHIPD